MPTPKQQKVAARPKTLPALRVVSTIAEAKRYLWRDGFSPDATVDPKQLITDLLALLDERLTPDERASVEFRFNGRPAQCQPRVVEG